MTDRSRESDVRRFLYSNVASQREPAFSTKGLYYNALPQPNWVAPGPDGLQAKIDQSRERFVAIMEEFKQSNPRARDSGCDLRGAHNWSEVLQIAQTAQEQYKAKAQGGVKSLFWRTERNVGSAAPGISTILNATLPCGEYSSLVSGSVILIFKAFDAVEEVRRLVAKCVSDSPIRLEQVERLMKIYPDRSTLSNAAGEVYLALLAALEGVVLWLKKNSLNRLKALMLQDRYEHDLKDQIGALEDSTRRLNEEANLCHQEKAQETASSTASIQADTNVLIQQNTQLLLSASEIYAGIQDVDDKLTGVGGTVNDMNGVLRDVSDDVQDMNALIRGLQDQQKLQSTVVNAISQMLRQHNAFNPGYGPIAGFLRNAHVVPNISTTDMLNILGDWTEHNASLVQYYSTVASDAAPAVAASITNSQQLGTWLTSQASHTLFVGYDLIDEEVQPGSFVTSALHLALTEMRPSLCLTYFCCKRSSVDCADPVANLLACLITGILRQYRIDVTRWADSMARPMHESYLKSRDLSYMCSLFKYLISSLQGVAVYCLLDDFLDLERTADRRSLCLAFNKIQEAVADSARHGNVVFKVLVMTIARDSIIYPEIRPEICQWLYVEPDQFRTGLEDEVNCNSIMTGLQDRQRMYT